MDESAGSASITITRADGSDGAVSVKVTSNDGTASVADEDYEAVNETVSFADGDVAAKTVTVRIRDDDDLEDDETLMLTLSTTTGGAGVGANTTAILTILDSDLPQPVAAFIARKDSAEAFELYVADETGVTLKLSPLLAFREQVVDFQWSPDRGRLAFAVIKDNGAELFSVRPDGNDLVKLDSSLPDVVVGVPGAESAFFAWSPDSSRLAYVADPDGDSVFGLFSITPDGQQSSQLATRIGSVLSGTFAWSPDGSRVAYVTSVQAGGVFELFSVRPDGTDLVKLNPDLVAGGDVTRFEWSPDGNRVTYVADQRVDEVVELFSVRPDGTDPVKLNPDPVAGGDVKNGFEWSPNGSRVAYLADQRVDEVIELFSVRPDGTDLVKLNPDLVAGGDVRGFEWSPDSSRVAYQADQDVDNVLELFSAAADATGSVKLNVPLSAGRVAASGSRFEFAWSPDGGRVAYTADEEVFGVTLVHIVNPDGTERVSVPTSGSGLSGVFPASLIWAPDASRLAFRRVGGQGGFEDLFSIRADGSDLTTVHSAAGLNGGPQLSRDVTWLPDSTGILFRAGTQEASFAFFDLFRVRADGTNDTKLSGPIVSTGSGVQLFRLAPPASD